MWSWSGVNENSGATEGHHQLDSGLMLLHVATKGSKMWLRISHDTRL